MDLGLKGLKEVRMPTWLYIFDEFRPLDIEPPTLFELTRDDPLRLFEYVKEIVMDYVKEIRSVKVLRKFFDSETFDLVVEYIVECEVGTISAKIIYSENPASALQKFYEHESYG